MQTTFIDEHAVRAYNVKHELRLTRFAMETNTHRLDTRSHVHGLQNCVVFLYGRKPISFRIRIHRDFDHFLQFRQDTPKQNLFLRNGLSSHTPLGLMVPLAAAAQEAFRL